jgi:hypothetical protein
MTNKDLSIWPIHTLKYTPVLRQLLTGTGAYTSVATAIHDWSSRYPLFGGFKCATTATARRR